MLNWVEYEKSFITSGPCGVYALDPSNIVLKINMGNVGRMSRWHMHVLFSYELTLAVLFRLAIIEVSRLFDR